jgi:AcrR family transcriptional regulator
MPLTETPRSTADARRTTVVAKAVTVFGRGGYHATPVTDVAVAAGISQAYVLRLFGGKLGLFTAALDRCYLLIREALRAGAEQVPDGTPAEVLEVMGDAYAGLISDRDLLMLQIHAQSASDIPEIRDAVQRGYASVVDLAKELSGGTDAEVQQFVALGQLCHLIVSAGLESVDADWARILTSGMRHPS